MSSEATLFARLHENTVMRQAASRHARPNKRPKRIHVCLKARKTVNYHKTIPKDKSETRSEQGDGV